MPGTVYVDTSVLVAAFTNEPSQALALSLLQDTQWSQVCVSDWTLAEFACAIQAKVLRGETPKAVAQTIAQTLNSLLAQGALRQIAVLREDCDAVRRTVPGLAAGVRGADALHLAVAQRTGTTHFASLDKTQRLAAQAWLPGTICVPAF